MCCYIRVNNAGLHGMIAPQVNCMPSPSPILSSLGETLIRTSLNTENFVVKLASNGLYFG